MMWWVIRWLVNQLLPGILKREPLTFFSTAAVSARGRKFRFFFFDLRDDLTRVVVCVVVWWRERPTISSKDTKNIVSEYHDRGQEGSGN